MYLIAVIVIVALALIFLFASIRILREYQRGVVFTLGRYTGTKGPGLFLLMPLVQQMVRVDLRVVLHLNDTIQPISEEYLARGLKHAADIHAEAVLIELNTPGGLLETTREMVQQITDSPIPVIVYVAPSGSRAGSAGFFLLEAADIAAMAPGTNAGASHPVIEGGAQPDPVMKQKMENDTTAFLRSFVARRNRNTSAAEDAVLNSKSYTEQDPAARQKLLHDAESILMAEQPVAPLMVNNDLWLVSKRVAGWHDNANNQHLSRFLSVGP